MSPPTAPPLPRAAQLTQMILGLMVSQAISTAATLGIADLLVAQPKTADELAAQTGLHAPSLYRLLRSLASVGVFAVDGEGRFALTELAEPLRSDVPDSLRAYAIFSGDEWHWRVWAHLGHSVRTGQPAFEHLHGRPWFADLAQNADAAKLFNDAMTSMSHEVSQAVVPAYDFSSVSKVVDVGGGHGFLLSKILEANPNVTGAILESPAVIDGARAAITASGLAHRCELVAGDFFEAVPPDGDAYIMKHILHDWDDDRAARILESCRRASGTAKVLVVEMMIPEGNAPSPGKVLDLAMLLVLNGRERTQKEYEALFARAGYKLARVIPTRSPYSIIEGVPV